VVWGCQNVKTLFQEGRVKKEVVCFASQYLVKVSQKKKKTSTNAGKIKGFTYLNFYKQLGVEEYRGFIEVSSALAVDKTWDFIIWVQGGKRDSTMKK
jgi:hypothetical protein